MRRSVEKVYRKAWEIFTHSKYEVLLYGVISVLLGYLTFAFHETSSASRVFVSFLSVVLLLFVNFLFLYWIDAHEHKKKLSFGESTSYTLSRFLPALVVTYTYTFAVAIALLFFIIPGIFLGIIWSQSVYFSFFQKKGIKESFAASRALTRGKRMMIFLVFLPIALLNLFYMSVYILYPQKGVLSSLVYTVIQFVHDIVWLVVAYALWTFLQKTKKAKEE